MIDINLDFILFGTLKNLCAKLPQLNGMKTFAFNATHLTCYGDSKI